MDAKGEPDFTDAAAFPQRSIIDGPAGTSNPTTEQSQRRDGPNFFRDQENVQFHFAKDLVQCTRRQDDVLLEVNTIGQLNRTTQTHNTVMPQFLEQPEISGRLFCRVSFPTAHIFRIVVGKAIVDVNGSNDEPTFPEAPARMLCRKLTGVRPHIQEHSGFVSISSSEIEIRVGRTPFNVQAYLKGSKTPFWRQRRSDLFTSDIVPTSFVSHEDRFAVFESFSIGSGDNIYGLGERFDAVNRVGRKTDFVNKDAIGTSNCRTYINVPFFWSTAGWGCLVNSTARTEFDVGVSEQGTLGFCTEDQILDYFVIAGPSPKEIMARYTQDLTGTAPILPVWTFGIWLSRNSYQSWAVVDEIIQKCDDLSIPVDTLHLDTFWFKQNWNPDYIFDENRFAQPEHKMAEYKKAGIHISLWVYNFAPPREDNVVFREGRDNGYFGTREAQSRELFAYPKGTRGTWTDDAVVDFSNPEAAEWFSKKMAGLVRQGASAIKVDFGDCIPPDAHYQRIEGKKFQNSYSLSYGSAIWNAIKKVDSNTILWARAGTAGSHRYPVHWGGDSQCSWSGLQGTLKSSLSIGLSGFAYHSHDIGGFIGKPTPELYVRWAQFGLLSSHSRSHGAGDENGREPWHFGDEAVKVFRKFACLRYRLLPYMVEEARVGASNGLPLVRAMVLEFPEDRSCWACESQYMFGRSLLIAPIVESVETSAEKAVYLPKGVWYDFWTKQAIISTGEWIVVRSTPLDSMPIWVRAGAVIPLAESRMRTYNTIGKIETVEVYGSSGHEKTMRYGHDETAIELNVGSRTVVGKETLVDSATKVQVYGHQER